MISIIIPSYNQQEYLPDAIDSVLSQTVKPLELIIVDDGSTDNSLEIAKKYEQDNPTLIRVVSQVNKGLASARNTGIMWAYGDYILPLDADDILLENCIEKVTEKIKETHADIVGLSFKCFGKSQEEVILMPNPALADFKAGNRLGYCAAIRKSKLLDCGGYSPRMTWGYEDLHLWFDLLSREAKVAVIQEFMWLYRVKEHSMLRDAQAHHDELMAQIRKDFQW